VSDDVVERDGLLHVRIAGVIDANAATRIAHEIHTYLDALGGGVRMLVDAKLERAAFIAPTSQTAALQLGRMIREAGSEVRRMFLEASEAIAWLRQ
jgi:hypothetical protein